MKTFLLTTISVLIIFMGIVIVTIFSEYKSAFEADQACHAELWNEYENLENYGCDHDLETNQWILFEKGINHQSGSVLKRFYY